MKYKCVVWQKWHELSDRRIACIFLPCQQINMTEMNVREAHCSAATGGISNTSFFCLSLFLPVCLSLSANFMLDLSSRLIVSLMCAHLCYHGVLMKRSNKDSVNLSGLDEAPVSLLSEVSVRAGVWKEETLPSQRIRCLAGAARPAKPPPTTLHLCRPPFCSISLPNKGMDVWFHWCAGGTKAPQL